MSFLLFMADAGTRILIGAAIGAGGGALIGLIGSLIVLLTKTKKIKDRFGVSKGMAYELVISALGEPISKVEKGEKTICKWNLSLDGKFIKTTVVFKDNVIKSIG